MKLLVVDDDADIGDSMAQALRIHFPRLDVSVANDGPSAIEAIKGEAPDLILTDFRMPKMTGIEMLQALKEEGFDIPAILFTAFREEQIAIDAARRGLIRRFHHKPPDLDAMVTSVSEILHPEQVGVRASKRRLKPKSSKRGWWSRRRSE